MKPVKSTDIPSFTPKVMVIYCLTYKTLKVVSFSGIAYGDGALAQKKRKLVKLTPEQLIVWSGMSIETMKSIAIAKYTQNPGSIASTVLKNTKDAELWHIVTSRGKPSELVRFEHLEYIRSSLL